MKQPKLISRRTGKFGSLLKISKKEDDAFWKVIHYVLANFKFNEENNSWTIPTKWGNFLITKEDNNSNHHYWIFIRFDGTEEQFEILKKEFAPYHYNTSGKWNIHSADPLTAVWELISRLEYLGVDTFNNY